MKRQHALIFTIGIFLSAVLTAVTQTATTINNVRPTISGFAPNPVSGFAPNPVNGFSQAPVRGLTPAPVSGFTQRPVGPFATNPVTGFTQAIPFTTPPAGANTNVLIVAPSVPQVLAAPNIRTIPSTATNIVPLF